MRILLIAVAGALGTLLRHGVSQMARRFVSTDWPLGTFVVNVVGCLILALLSEMILRGTKIPDDVRIAISVGFCGGLTTYSSLNQDALTLIREGQAHVGVLYFIATVVACALAAVLGVVLARALTA